MKQLERFSVANKTTEGKSADRNGRKDIISNGLNHGGDPSSGILSENESRQNIKKNSEGKLALDPPPEGYEDIVIHVGDPIMKPNSIFGHAAIIIGDTAYSQESRGVHKMSKDTYLYGGNYTGL